jgi:hypothetical protein
MTIFLKVKKIDFFLNNAYRFTNIKNDLFTIRCAIKFYVKIVITLFVYQRFFGFKSGLKCVSNFFYLILSKPLKLFYSPTTSKNGRFHGDVTFISAFDGIRDIFETQFMMQLYF